MTSGDSADERFHARAGNDRVVSAPAARVGERRISRSRPVMAVVARSDGRYAVQVDDIGAIVAHVVVIAIPSTNLREVDLDRLALPSWRRRAIDELGMGTTAQLLLPLTRAALDGACLATRSQTNHEASPGTRSPPRACHDR